MAQISQIGHRDLLKVLLERERLGSTGIGGGIGIPHGKVADLETPLLGFGISHQGVDFDAIDQQPVHLFFILLTPSNATGTHLGLLARISRLLKDEKVKNQLRLADSPQAVRSIIAANDTDD
jgi:PTS system nitrogen regulatory IIA component